MISLRVIATATCHQGDALNFWCFGERRDMVARHPAPPIARQFIARVVHRSRASR